MSVSNKLSMWQINHFWLRRNLSCWQPLIQPLMAESSIRWPHWFSCTMWFRFNSVAPNYAQRTSLGVYFVLSKYELWSFVIRMPQCAKFRVIMDHGTTILDNLIYGKWFSLVIGYSMHYRKFINWTHVVCIEFRSYSQHILLLWNKDRQKAIEQST